MFWSVMVAAQIEMREKNCDMKKSGKNVQLGRHKRFILRRTLATEDPGRT